MKHELKASIKPKYQVITGSQTYFLWELEDLKRIRSIKNSGGWAWWKIFNLIKKIPEINTFEIPENNYNFKSLYFLKNFTENKKAYRYDINKAYRSILTPFLFSFLEKKDLDYIFNQKQKASFNHAVGFCGYHKTIIEIATGEIVEEKKPARPDILAFCTNYLLELKTAFQKEFGGFFFMFVDAFSFEKSQSDKELEAFATLILKNYYKKQGFEDIYKKNPSRITFKKDVFTASKNGIQLFFDNEKEQKTYQFLNPS